MDNFETKSIDFSIYQLSDDSDAKFVPIEEQNALGVQLDTSDYVKLYSGSMSVNVNSSTFAILEMIYEKFNIDRLLISLVTVFQSVM